MKRALFLDRDGVVNIEINYLYKIEDFDKKINEYYDLEIKSSEYFLLWELPVL